MDHLLAIEYAPWKAPSPNGAPVWFWSRSKGPTADAPMPEPVLKLMR
jgi:hypothetical protein